MHEAIPDYYFFRAADITPEFIKKHGIQAVGIDLDNTMVFDMTATPLPGVKEWIRSLRDAGIPAVIITNAQTLRSNIAGKKFGLKSFPLARKPKIKKILAGAQYLDCPIEKFALIGDQLFYDVAGANRAGAISIKVDPSAPEIFFAGKFRRRREKERLFIEDHADVFPKMRGLNDEY